MTVAILIKNGRIINPLAEATFVADIKLENGKICKIAENINAAGNDIVYDATNKFVMPGLVDMHVHISHCPDGHRMLIKAGVTTALDVAGLPDEMIDGHVKAGAGLTLGYLYPLIPAKTISSENPTKPEISRTMDAALEQGALGVKILGGHYPLTPEATRSVFEIAHKHHCWVAAHAGTTASESDIDGFEELVQLCGNYPVHIVHVNSFCRGMVDDPIEEAHRAVAALKTVPDCCSESYLAMINGTSGAFRNGEFESNVTKRSLASKNYSLDLAGMKQAIKDGWAQVHFHDHGQQEIVLADPQQGLELYFKNNTDIFVSFAVNTPVSSIPVALAQNRNGQFVVDALATDGGAIPRNVTLKQGLSLVRFGALSLNSFAHKACYRPAQLLGLTDKGFISEGADADIIIVDPAMDKPELVIVNGGIVMQNNTVVSTGGRFITLEEGRSFYGEKSINSITVSPDWLE